MDLLRVGWPMRGRTERDEQQQRGDGRGEGREDISVEFDPVDWNETKFLV